MKIKIAIFLSGSGSNARRICEYYKNHSTIEVGLLASNKLNSGTKEIANDFDLPYYIFDKNEYNDQELMLQLLKSYQIDYIILAGFLWLIPNYLLQNYTNKIINIHPALLPKYGGKGMHGVHVHQAVYENNEKESGITIHLCNEKYDEGKILFQSKVNLSATDTPDIIAQKVLKLEHQYFAKVIEEYILQNI